jgi:hypothetical protein
MERLKFYIHDSHNEQLIRCSRTTGVRAGQDQVLSPLQSDGPWARGNLLVEVILNG